MTHKDTTARPLTRTGPIRLGLDYQDTFALHKIVEWLEHPKRYIWMKLEADEYEYLDDVVLASPENKLEVIQVKYRSHPDAPVSEWTWDSFLKPRRGQRRDLPSLFQKWFYSWQKARKQFDHVTGFLATNASASEETLGCCAVDKSTGGWRIIPETFKERFHSHYQQALGQIGTQHEADLAQFLSHFIFLLGYQELEVLQEVIQRRLADLRVSETGTTSLQAAVRKWTIERHSPNRDGIILLENVWEAAQWVRPRPLRQEFPIPQDFVLFDQEVHSRLLNALRSPAGGIKVVYGSPGSGKSSYLSFLCKDLEKHRVACLRHHYFLQFTDPERFLRVRHERALETILHDLLIKAPQSLGEKRFQNPTTNAFADFIAEASSYFAQRGESLVLIVDGLDHVTRDVGESELRRFLHPLLPIPRGLWLVLGTRPLPTDVLPRDIYQYAPEKEWIETTELDRDKCQVLLGFHRDELRLPNEPTRLQAVVDGLYEKTRGHPLVIHYAIEFLCRRRSSAELWTTDIEEVPPFAGEIDSFYQDLWRSFPREASEVATLLAVAAFPMRQNWIVECLDPSGGSTHQLVRSLEQILHLVRTTSDGLEFFHTSFLEFIRRTNEYRFLQSTVARKLRDWLKAQAIPNLRWAYLNRVEYILGNTKAILESLGRKWAEEAIAHGKSLDQMLEQVRLGIHVSMKNDDYAHAHSLGMLAQYLERAPSEAEEAWETIWRIARRNQAGTRPKMPRPQDLEYLSTPRILEIAQEAADRRNVAILRSAFHVINLRASKYRIPDINEPVSPGEWWSEARALCRIVALGRFRVDALIDWAKRLRTKGRSSQIIGEYATSLAKTHQWTTLQKIFSKKLHVKEKRVAIEALARNAIEIASRDFRSRVLRVSPTARGPWASLYLALTGSRRSRIQLDLPKHSSLASTLEEYHSSAREVAQKLFVELYLSSLAAGVMGRTDRIARWISRADLSLWPHAAATTLLTVGMEHGAEISGGKAPSYSSIVNALAAIKVPKWPKQREIWGLWQAFKNALRDVLLIDANLQSWTRSKPSLSFEDVNSLKDSDFFGKDAVIHVLLSSRPQIMERADVQEYLLSEETHWASIVDSFPDRAKYYAELATLANRYQLHEDRTRLTSKTADNCLGYGYHKDIYLYEILKTIDACHGAGSTHAENWLNRVAPTVQSVRAYTDGDETRDLPVRIAESYLRTKPNALRAYYLHTVSDEQLFLAEEIFPLLVDSLDLSDPVARAIAMTAVDHDSWERLRAWSSSGDQQAQQVIQSLSSEFHSLDAPIHTENREQNHTPLLKPEEEDANKMEQIHPSELSDSLLKLKAPYDQEKYLDKWTAVWFKKTEVRQNAYGAVKNLIDSEVLRYCGGKTLKKMIPLALEFDGADQAFKYMCKAHEEIHGWIWYFQSFKDVEPLWALLGERFPNRWREFIQQTRTTSEFDFPANRITSLPLRRGCEFLIRFNALREAESITEAAVCCVEELMADMVLPLVPWLDRQVLPSHWDILCCRLVNPSFAVRERAAAAISELLNDSTTRSETFERLCEWLSKVRLESITILGLLPVARSVRQHGTSLGLDIDKLEASISPPSALSDLILREIRKHARQDHGTSL